MGSHRERGEYLTRLRRIVIHSADVLPREVTDYLKGLAERGRWEVRKQILKDYRPLVDYLAKEYVDLLTEILIKKPRRIADSDDYGFEDLNELGIHDVSEFFPAAHLQGPFLYLLRRNEEEGLRLVQTLTNTAAAAWRRKMQAGAYSGRSMTPLPVVIDLPSGPREFWGDPRVYSWFRSHGMGPKAVTCALMALEVWMEEQVEGGRSPDELLHKVLSRDHCVAVLGVCLGVALAFPVRCLKAAMPIVGSPAVWKMDIARFANDRIRSFYPDPFGRNKVIYEQVAERDKRPQRSREIRHLVPYYLFSKDLGLRAQFKKALSLFTERLPFLFAEEQQSPLSAASLREDMENFQSYADETNYYLEEADGNPKIIFQPPRQIQERNAGTLKAVHERLSWSSLDVWAQKTIEAGHPASGMSLKEAVDVARKLQKDGDFSTPHEIGNDLSGVRLQAIAGVACAALIADFEWCKKQGLILWARGILLAAARVSPRGNMWAERDSIFSSDPKVSAALGLGMLIVQGEGDIEVRNQILSLVADPQLQVVGAAFRGLQKAWTVDKLLCWSALSLALSLSVVPRRYIAGWNETSEVKRNQGLIEAYVSGLKGESIIALPRIREGEKETFLWDTAWRAIGAIPLPEATKDQGQRKQLIQLTDDLLAWTIRENVPPEDHPHRHEPGPYNWNNALLGWVAELTGYISPDESREHVLEPIRKTWPRAPRLTADLLDGYISFRIGFMEPLSPQTQNEWREICKWVLESPVLTDWADYDYLSSEIFDTVSRVVYTAYGHSVLKEDWPHAALFLDITEKWVKVIGRNPDAFSCLMIFLNGPGWQFAPEPALQWLYGVCEPLDDPDRIWHKNSNGETTAELLQRIVKNFAPQLYQNPESLRRFSYLTDRLVESGVPLAGLIQTQLEERPNS